MSKTITLKNNSFVTSQATKLGFKKLDPKANLPSYATEGAAGMDIAALEGVDIGPGNWVAVRTGLAVEIPPGHEIQVRPRSGLAAKFGITVLNAPGTIDSDYRGEIKVILINHGTTPFSIAPGDRIAQLIFAAFVSAQIEEITDLSPTERAAGGFGSTGVS